MTRSRSSIRPALGRATLALFALTLLFAPGCARNKARKHWWQFWRPKAPASNLYNPEVVSIPPPPDVLQGSAAGRGLPPETPPKPGELAETEAMRRAAVQASELQMVHFAYDSAELSSEAMQVLDANVAWLMAHPDYDIQIQGHTDERGTTEYNFSLGDRRAKSVREYLVARGIPADKLHTQSFGEEQPLEPLNNEGAYSKNRRVQFLVYNP